VRSLVLQCPPDGLDEFVPFLLLQSLAGAIQEVQHIDCFGAERGNARGLDAHADSRDHMSEAPQQRWRIMRTYFEHIGAITRVCEECNPRWWRNESASLRQWRLAGANVRVHVKGSGEGSSDLGTQHVD
jgi:hypothetical protein